MTARPLPEVLRKRVARLEGYGIFHLVMTTLVETLVPNELWAVVAPLLPPAPRPWYGGRTRTIPDRNCFAAIVYMARTSAPWRLLPAGELGCCSEVTVRRRLVEWSNAAVCERLQDQLPDRLGTEGLLDWSRASLDTMSVRAKCGDHVGANPVDGGKPWSKLHLIVDDKGCRWCRR
jgi:transposase